MTTPSAESALSAQEIEQLRLDFESHLMEADRMMMQALQTSLSLIGFGFTMTTFINDLSERLSTGSSGSGARVMGISLLLIGLLFLGSSTWVQARYRRELIRRVAAAKPAIVAWSGMQGGATPSFIGAILLLMAGLFSLGLALVQWLL